MYAVLFGALFLMSQMLQTGLGYTPLQAGIRLLPWTLPPMVIAPLAGTMADRYGNRPFMMFGLVLQAAGHAPAQPQPQPQPQRPRALAAETA
jgi:MFS family permease